MSTSCTEEILQNLNESTFYSWTRQKQDKLNLFKSAANSSSDEFNDLNVEISTTLDCLNEKNDSISSINTQNALMRSDIASKKKELLTREDDIKIAKDRALLVRNPELSTSYYDGWFSLNRPMHKISVPIIIGFSVFFMSLSLFMILSLLNVNTVFTVLVSKPSRYYSQQSLFGGPFMIMSIIAVVLLILTIYAFLR